eukprot:SAG31_NODE_50_length_30520_cov_89.906712_29_plen_165_part_00
MEGLFVASFGGDEVLRFSAAGKLLQRYGNEDEVDCPEGVALGPTDNMLYVSSWHRGWVVRYDVQTGAFRGTFGPTGVSKDASNHYLAFPEELAFTRQGPGMVGGPPRLLVSHFYSNSIEQYAGRTGASLGPLQRGKLVRGPVGITVGWVQVEIQFYHEHSVLFC